MCVYILNTVPKYGDTLGLRSLIAFQETENVVQKRSFFSKNNNFFVCIVRRLFIGTFFRFSCSTQIHPYCMCQIIPVAAVFRIRCKH